MAYPNTGSGGSGLTESQEAKLNSLRTDGQLPTGYSHQLDGTDLVLYRGSREISRWDADGFIVKGSSTAGPSSFHLGGVRTIGAGGDQVSFVNEVENVAQYPSWGTLALDGSTYEPVMDRIHGVLVAEVEPNGALGTNVVTYDFDFTSPADLAFFQISVVPAENYNGRVIWRALVDGDVLSDFSVDDEVWVDGVEKLIPFKHVLWVRSGSTVSVSLEKEDTGELIATYSGTTDTTTAWRKTWSRSYFDSTAINANNPELIVDGITLRKNGNGLLEVDPTNIDALQLQNIATLLSGGAKGTFDETAVVTDFEDAVDGNWWKYIPSANQSLTLAGATYQSGDILWCYTDTTGIALSAGNFADYFARIPDNVVVATASAYGAIILDGDLGGNAASPQVVGINGQTINGTLVEGQAYVLNDSNELVPIYVTEKDYSNFGTGGTSRLTAVSGSTGKLITLNASAAEAGALIGIDTDSNNRIEPRLVTLENRTGNINQFGLTRVETQGAFSDYYKRTPSGDFEVYFNSNRVWLRNLSGGELRYMINRCSTTLSNYESLVYNYDGAITNGGYISAVVLASQDSPQMYGYGEVTFFDTQNDSIACKLRVDFSGNETDTFYFSVIVTETV